MNVLRIIFDPTINGGVNGVAIGVYSVAVILGLTAYFERNKS